MTVPLPVPNVVLAAAVLHGPRPRHVPRADRHAFEGQDDEPQRGPRPGELVPASSLPLPPHVCRGLDSFSYACAAVEFRCRWIRVFDVLASFPSCPPPPAPSLENASLSWCFVSEFCFQLPHLTPPPPPPLWMTPPPMLSIGFDVGNFASLVPLPPSLDDASPRAVDWFL